MGRIRVVALALLAFLQAPVAARPSLPAGHSQHLAAVPLSIAGAGGTHRFRVEVARTFEEQQIGLMFRRHIAAGGGMIFPMTPPREASFWMKNTLVPLDLVFIRADGTIARIAERTPPLSLDPIDAGEPVAAVLELAGGRAAALGIVAGDRVSWPG